MITESSPWQETLATQLLLPHHAVVNEQNDASYHCSDIYCWLRTLHMICSFHLLDESFYRAAQNIKHGMSSLQVPCSLLPVQYVVKTS